MPEFIISVNSFSAGTDEKLDLSHWIVKARDLNEAEQLGDGQITNANRTIPSVRLEKVDVKPFSLSICNYLARNLNCQGHQDIPALAQARSGNET